jgi:Mg/Co/Ni transporter MgtE
MTTAETTDHLVMLAEMGREDHVQEAMRRLHPADAAEILDAIEEDDLRSRLFAHLETPRAAAVLSLLGEQARETLLDTLPEPRLRGFLTALESDDAADLLAELPPEQAEQLLALVEPDDAEDLRRLLAYEEYTAGGMMTPEPVILPPDSTVAEALARVRDSDLSPALAAQVYVVRAPFETPTGKYLGVAHFQRLLREPPSTLVSAVLDDSLEPIGPAAPLSQVTRYFATYNLVALPVVDENDHLLGAVTVDDVIDHMLPEDWREGDAGFDSDDDDEAVTHGA